MKIFNYHKWVSNPQPVALRFQTHGLSLRLDWPRFFSTDIYSLMSNLFTRGCLIIDIYSLIACNAYVNIFESSFLFSNEGELKHTMLLFVIT